RMAEDHPDADPEELAYFANIEATLEKELADVRRSVARIEAQLPVLEQFTLDRGAFLARVVMFARGGYGRGEMTFSSDLDNGYCLDTRALDDGEATIYREWIMRLESLLSKSGIVTAHQYFEIDEDLSRFTLPETVHTITSILESRALVGHAGLLQELKARFWEIFPFEVFLAAKLEEYPGRQPPPLTTVDVKNGPGGMRTVQIPLWILGAFNLASSFMTADLLRLAEESGMLGASEATRLVRALEWIMEMRNFVGAAERYYDDQESRESNVRIAEFRENVFDDAMARLYVLRKSRFPSLDALDGYRLQLLNDAREVGTRMLERMLDRTFTQEIAPAALAVIHRGRKQIISLRAREGKPPAHVSTLFPDGRALMNLLEFVANSGYGLAQEILEELGGTVMRIASTAQQPLSAGDAEVFSRLVGAPHAHLALEMMFAINDPAAPELPTLIGRFIPEFDRLRFLLRKVDQGTIVVHTHITAAVAQGERLLLALRASFPEYHALLQPQHVLAVKWSLLLHGLGYVDAGGGAPARTAELAAEELSRLGYENEALVNTVRLLVEHCRTLSDLSRTATYSDQALARYFEVADRNVINVILLYLVNLGIVQALTPVNEHQVAMLRNFFREAEQILSAMRGVFDEERALTLINSYFDQKKNDLIEDTRAYLLYQKTLTLGMSAAVFDPIATRHPADWPKVSRFQDELNQLYRNIVLNAGEPAVRERNMVKIVQTLRNCLPPQIIDELTRDREDLFKWFFATVPNRYLMGMRPAGLSVQLAKFASFRNGPVIVDVLGGGPQGAEGLLICTTNLARSHMRVAYCMNQRRINIHSGKINRFELAGGRFGYCYYFQVTQLDRHIALNARDLEGLIRDGAPPELTEQSLAPARPFRGARVDYLGDDEKGYLIKEEEGEFHRREANFRSIRVVFRDEPFLFFKVCRAFDLFNVEVLQALITTTGNRVLDYFYLAAEDYERLFARNFEETLVQMVNTNLLQPDA
ncbi:MAG: hypothetical protein HY342_08505, partial [Candidatus Lambdaproteobacteria bacterium]|nr:hypothetical protein [Candidatus Lambdaproteobacteria bacterium]